MRKLLEWLRQALRSRTEESVALRLKFLEIRSVYNAACKAFHEGDRDKHAALVKKHAALKAEYEAMAARYEERFL